MAEGYTELLDEVRAAVYGDPGMTDSTTARLAYIGRRPARLLRWRFPTQLMTNYGTPQEKAVADASEGFQREAKAEFDAVASGPIYQAGVAEWMAKSAVTNSIDAYNMAVEAWPTRR